MQVFYRNFPFLTIALSFYAALALAEHYIITDPCIVDQSRTYLDTIFPFRLLVFFFQIRKLAFLVRDL